MKKIPFVLTAALAVVACQKNDAVVNDVLVSIPVTVEPLNTPTKASVVVDGTKFTPSLTDGDVFALMSNTSATQKYNFTYSKADDAITGSYPTSSSSTTVRYIVVNQGSGYAGSAAKFARFEIEANQKNNEGEFGKNLMLIGVTEECTLGDAPSAIEFKTMCSLLEFDVTNTLSDKTYLESIKVEAGGGEQIAGRFAISKTYSANWMDSYSSEDTGINDENKSSSVTVDCGKTELTAASAQFYVACAFGTLSQGLKVTFTLSYEDGSKSLMIKTIGKSGLTLARNTLYQIPTVVSDKGPVVSFDSVNVSDVSNKGDNISLKYTVSNPIEGESISATSDASWVNTFDYSTADELRFVVDANEGVARTATVTVSYKNAVPITITVSQLKADAAKVQYTVTYTVNSVTEVTISGTAPTGSSATFVNTYNPENVSYTPDKCQMTKNNSQTYTLSGYNGKTIKKVVLSMKSNAKKGKGTFSLTAGSTSLASISTSTAFNSWFDSKAYSTAYKDVTVTLTNDKYEIQSGEKVVLVIAATENSLYCQSVTITYE